MATLEKRANPLQRRLFRIVKGSIQDAANAHPGWKISERMKRSIAKRVVGTLSAELSRGLVGGIIGPHQQDG